MDKENVTPMNNGLLFSHKKNEILSFVTTWMELGVTIVTWDKSQKENIHDLTHVKYATVDLIQQNSVTGGWEERGVDKALSMDTLI
jgi:hypothetical protein